MAGIKIVDLPALGRNLSSTDLFELSLTGGTGSRKITGQEILNSARLGLQPNITLTTTGSSGSSTFAGDVLNVPTYTLSGLGGVPTTRTLTINGVAQDLSTDRSWTISTGLTIGTTAITSGTVGRVLFEGTGNVVSESANLFWDNTNGRLGIGTSSPTASVNIVGGTETFTGYQRSLWLKTSTNAKSSVELVLENTFTTTGRMYELASYSDGTFNITDRTNSGLRLKIDSNYFQFHSSSSSNSNLLGTLASINALWFNQTSSTATTSNYTLCNASGLTLLNAPTGGSIYFRIGNAERLLLTNGGNFLIGTTTDAGYKLDVNGTARVVNNILSGNGNYYNTSNQTIASTSNASHAYMEISGASGNNSSLVYSKGGLLSTVWQMYTDDTNNYAIFRNGINRQIFKIFESTKNVGIDEVAVSSSFSDIASAKLFVNSTTKGFLPPRMTTTQKNAIASPAAGLVVYDTTLNKLCVYTTAWETITSV